MLSTETTEICQQECVILMLRNSSSLMSKEIYDSQKRDEVIKSLDGKAKQDRARALF